MRSVFGSRILGKGLGWRGSGYRVRGLGDGEEFFLDWFWIFGGEITFRGIGAGMLFG